MACDITTKTTNACTSGIGKVVDRVTLLQLIAQSFCTIVANGGITPVAPALPVGTVAFDTFESYAAADPLDTLNGGTNWAAAYSSR